VSSQLQAPVRVYLVKNIPWLVGWNCPANSRFNRWKKVVYFV